MKMDRRSVLQAGGVALAAGVVAACASDDSSSAQSTPAQPDGADAGGDQATEAGDSAEVTSPSDPLASTEDIPVGGGLVIAEPAIVVTQPTAGEYKAFTAICPHQGCLVSEVTDNEIVCPCHGSRFSAQDGSVLQGPARQGLTSAGVAVDGGSVVLS